MIKNERQYRITKTQLDRFRNAISHAANSTKSSTDDPMLKEAELAALQSQYEDLRDEIRSYEELLVQKPQVVEAESFDDLPEALIRARIAAGLSHKELASRLNLREQQVQRYEATNYAGASFSRLSEIVKALGVAVREDIFVPEEKLTLSSFLSRLESLGISASLAKSRFMPKSGLTVPSESTPSTIAEIVLRTAAAMRRIYGWSLAAVLGDDQPIFEHAISGAARFKVPAKASDRMLSAYVPYVYYVARLALRTTKHIATKTVPKDPFEVSNAIQSSYGQLNFSSALQYVWSLGIVVLPLDDPGGFHGAFWRVQGRNVIVLKQKTQSEARWMFDLFHETWHAGQEADLSERTIIELPETDPERRKSDEEKIASRFAGSIVLHGRGEELVQALLKDSNGEIPRFKTLVPKIAKQENVSSESLANYVAFRLSLQGENWWGTANNLQTEGDPWTIARDRFLLNCDLSGLDELDRNILSMALQSTREVSE